SPWPYLFLGPFLAGFGFFFAYPAGQSLVMRFQREAGTAAARPAGLANYAFAAGDLLLWLSLLNTLLFAVVFLVVQIPASLGLALLVERARRRVRPVLRFVFFSTHLVGVVFAAVLFSDMLSGRHSLVSRSLMAIRLTDAPVDLLNREFWAMPVMLA